MRVCAYGEVLSGQFLCLCACLSVSVSVSVSVCVCVSRCLFLLLPCFLPLFRCFFFFCFFSFSEFLIFETLNKTFYLLYFEFGFNVCFLGCLPLTCGRAPVPLPRLQKTTSSPGLEMCQWPVSRSRYSLESFFVACL